MKKFLIALSALSLAACGVNTSTVPLTPADVANQVKLDEQVGLAVETMYTGLTKAGALAFRAGVVKPSTNPAVQLDSFCPLVWQGQFTPTDKGSQLMALECKLRRARNRTREAYDDLNGPSYTAAAEEAIALGKEIIALIQGD